MRKFRQVYFIPAKQEHLVKNPRLMNFIVSILIGCSFGADVQAQAASLSVDKPNAQIKEPVTATYSLSYEDCEGGWIGVFVKGTPDDAYFWTKTVAFDENKQLVDNTHTVYFDNPGSYEFRLFEDYYGQRKVATGSVEVVFAPTSTISVSASFVPGNQIVTAQYTISERDGLDTGGWIGFYKVGSDDGSYVTYQKTGGISGTFEVTMPEGRDENYEFRLFMDYYGQWKLATSPPVRAAASDDELAQPVDSKARFNNIRGIVELSPDPDRVEWAAVNLKQVIYVGDHIQTGEDSSAVIQLSDMSTYVIPPNSEVIILEPLDKGGKLRLVIGRIWNNTRRMFDEGTLEVEMGQAVAGIRGTTFVCEENQGVSTLKVIEGKVEMTLKNGGKSQMVAAGEMLSADAGGFKPKETFDINSEQAMWEKLGAHSCGVYKDELALNFPGYGLYQYDKSGGWKLWNTVNPSHIVTVDLNGDGMDELVGNFPGYGLYKKTSANDWQPINTVNPEKMAAADIDGDGDDELVAGFSGYGLYYYDETGGWSPPINDMIAQAMVRYSNGVACDFGIAYGLWSYNTSEGWVPLSALNPDKIVAADIDGDAKDELLVSFVGSGLYIYEPENKTWDPINTVLPDKIVAVDIDRDDNDELVASFTGYGLYTYEPKGRIWDRINTEIPEAMIRLGNGIAADYGAAYGLWTWNQADGWVQRNTVDPGQMTAADIDNDGVEEMVVSFSGYGLYYFDETNGWQSLNAVIPEDMKPINFYP